MPALRTDNPESAKIRLRYSGRDLGGVVGPRYNDVKYLDEYLLTNDWQEIKSQTGYIKTILFREPGIKDIIIEEETDQGWTEVERLILNVKDKAAGEDAWYKSVIESEISPDMTDYEKMCKVTQYVLDHFVYKANDGTYLVQLTTDVGPWWEVRQIDCLGATRIVREFATRFGLESESTYAGYANHHYATVYIDGTGYVFDASPYGDSNIVTEWEYVLE